MFAVEPLVVSTTSISDYRRCRKKYELAYIMNRDVPSSEAAELGSEFHAIMHAVARQDRAWIDEHKHLEMYPIAQAYLQQNGFPRFDRILAAEDSSYTQVLDEQGGVYDPDSGTPLYLPAVFIRTTHDLVYRTDQNWIVGRDYKTFDRAPTFDVDLDFQGRIYIGALMKQHKTDRVSFEYENVRRELGRELKGKGFVKWEPDERYVNIPLLVPAHEIATLWRELRQDCDDLRRALQQPQREWTRTDLKVGPHSCNSCFHRELCKAELQQNGLTEDTLDFHSVARNPADRMTVKGILTDPRVLFWSSKAKSAEERAFANENAVRQVYGPSGVSLIEQKAAALR